MLSLLNLFEDFIRISCNKYLHCKVYNVILNNPPTYLRKKMPETFNMAANRLFTRLENLALSKKVFWWLNFCKNWRFMNSFVAIVSLFVCSRKISYQIRQSQPIQGLPLWNYKSERTRKKIYLWKKYTYIYDLVKKCDDIKWWISIR